MKKFAFIIAICSLAFALPCRGQHGGNIGYSQAGAKARAEQLVQGRRTLPEQDQPPTRTSTFVEADVLMNVKADEYVAVFGIAQEGETVADCSRKMEAVVREFTEALKALGIVEDDLFLDFVTQVKVYGFEVTGDIAREKLVGFELKKNLAIHYKDRALVDKLVVAAARSKIDDLIKVDYVVKDVEAIHDRLMDEASKVVKRKMARYENLLGIKLQPPAQVFAEKHGAFYPSGMYDSYTAAESEEIGTAMIRQKYTVQSARKGRTMVFNGLDGNGFDAVINPVIIEPVVQFTLHLKVKYEVEQIKAR
jgi:uncharacterized protein YggE